MSVIQKYSPKTIEDLVFENEDNRNFFNDFVNGYVSNKLLLLGTQGISKTTIANLLPKLIEGGDPYVLHLDGEEKFDVKDAIKKVKGILNFAGTDTQKYQYIIFDEIDKVRNNLSAFWQVMDRWNDQVILIAIANEITSIHKSVRSRLRTIKIDPISAESFLPRAMEILNAEGVMLNELYVLNKLHAVEAFGDLRKYLYVVEDLIRNSQNNRLDTSCYVTPSNQASKPVLRLINPSSI
jgi:DNA polymerase III delta prime subunit